MLISTLPRHFESTEELGAWITNGLAEGLDSDPASPKTSRMLDKRIFAQTETLGWRIFYSELVQMRLRAWETEPCGVECYEQFGTALVKFARFMQRMDLPPLDPGLHSNKQKTVKELRLAFKVLGQRVQSARKSPTAQQLRFWFEEILSTGDFPFLQVNLDSWLSFFTTQTGLVQKAFNSPRFPAATLYDSWLAASTGYEPVTVRQKISTLKL
jgi:hypothetical protein